MAASSSSANEKRSRPTDLELDLEMERQARRYIQKKLLSQHSKEQQTIMELQEKLRILQDRLDVAEATAAAVINYQPPPQPDADTLFQDLVDELRMQQQPAAETSLASPTSSTSGTSIVDDEDSRPVCPICREIVSNDDNAWVLSCGHPLHVQCYRRLIRRRRNRQCPLCRAPL